MKKLPPPKSADGCLVRYYDSGCICKELHGRQKKIYQTQKICLVLDRIFESISDISTAGFVYFIVFY